MRQLWQTLLGGEPPSPAEVIEIKKWLREYPETDLAARLAERFPHLVSDDRRVVGQ